MNCSKDDEAREVQRTAHSARRTTATSLPLPASKTPQAINQGMRHRGSLRTKARGIRWWMWMAAIECMWIRLDESHTPKPQTIIGTRSVFTACTAQDAVFLSTFSYVCPEPVLVNRSFLAYKWLQEGVFLAFSHRVVAKSLATERHDRGEQPDAPASVAPKQARDALGLQRREAQHRGRGQWRRFRPSCFSSSSCCCGGGGGCCLLGSSGWSPHYSSSSALGDREHAYRSQEQHHDGETGQPDHQRTDPGARSTAERPGPAGSAANTGAPSTPLLRRCLLLLRCLRTAAVPTVVACTLAVRRGAPRAVKAGLRADAVWRKLSGPTEGEAAPAVPTLAIALDDAVRLLKPDPSHTCPCPCLCLRRRRCCCRLAKVAQLLLPHSESPF